MYEVERIILLNIKAFIVDLCYVDRAFLVSSIMDGKHDCINDIVDSSSEMFFKPGTLRYTFGSRLTAGHGASPAISLDMCFAHKAVAVPFLLHLENDCVGVALMDSKPSHGQSAATLHQLLDALCDARIDGRFHIASIPTFASVKSQSLH